MSDELSDWMDMLESLPANGGDDVHCGYACEYVAPYGFVPEADCPVHDAPRIPEARPE